MNKYKVYTPVVLIILLFVSLVVFRDKMVNYISASMTEQMTTDDMEKVRSFVKEQYDYGKNGKGYRYTFLEFGSTGCNACRQMEGVMEEIKSKFPDTVNVVFINVMEKENKAIVDYYGIATIPTQILLDRQGKAFYRHSEYLSADDTSIKFK